jgi:hypothetical protein
MKVGRRGAGIALLVTVAFALTGVAQRGPRPEECEWRCERGLDTAQCVSTGFMGARNCSVVSNCTIFVIPSNPPEIGVSCTYDCQLEYCVWV